MERLELLAESYDRASGPEDRTPRPNVRGRKLSWFVMLVLPPVARITNSPLAFRVRIGGLLSFQVGDHPVEGTPGILSHHPVDVPQHVQKLIDTVSLQRPSHENGHHLTAVDGDDVPTTPSVVPLVVSGHVIHFDPAAIQ